MAFDEKDTPKFLVAFYERAGKKKKQIILNIRRFWTVDLRKSRKGEFIVWRKKIRKIALH